MRCEVELGCRTVNDLHRQSRDASCRMLLALNQEASVDFLEHLALGVGAMYLCFTLQHQADNYGSSLFRNPKARAGRVDYTSGDYSPVNLLG